MGGQVSTLKLIETGKTAELRKRLDEQPHEVNGRYPDGFGEAPYWIHGGSYLHWAVYHKKIDIVKVFLEHTANVHQTSTNGNTPLHAACANGDIEMAKLLIQHGADINATNALLESPLDKCTTCPICACFCHSEAMTEELLAYYNTNKPPAQIIVR